MIVDVVGYRRNIVYAIIVHRWKMNKMMMMMDSNNDGDGGIDDDNNESLKSVQDEIRRYENRIKLHGMYKDPKISFVPSPAQ